MTEIAQDNTENTSVPPENQSPPSEKPPLTDQSFFTRQQRRQKEREIAKQIVQEAFPTRQPSTKEFVTISDFNKLVADIQKIVNYTKLVDNHVWMLVETLTRKEILNWNDVNDTEQLYLKKEENRKIRIKELLDKNLTAQECVVAVKESESLPGWEKFNINPVKDLNQNPFEIAEVLKETNPEVPAEELVSLYKLWGLTREHFGLKDVPKS